VPDLGMLQEFLGGGLGRGPSDQAGPGMTTRAPSTGPVPPWGLALASMLSVQLGSALSVHLISAVGPAGTAWLRLSAGALIFLALARPPLRAVRPHDMPALLGVVLLTQPWHGGINPAGIGFAGLAAIGWATYILLTQRIGDRFAGIGGLSLTVPIAAATAAIFGIPQATGHLTLGTLAAAAGLAILLPVLPFAFELLALRQMTPTAFGTLMALEPAIGVLLGLLVLHQKPATTQLAGILLVVLAGTAAQRGGRRRPQASERAGGECCPILSRKELRAVFPGGRQRRSQAPGRRQADHGADRGSRLRLRGALAGQARSVGQTR